MAQILMPLMMVYLGLESKLETNDWSKRVNMSILGMIVVDCFLVYSQLVQQEAENDFYV